MNPSIRIIIRIGCKNLGLNPDGSLKIGSDHYIYIIIQHPVETKEVHCTATYGRKSANFQWTVSREMVSLEGFKKKLCEYFTFPDGTENEHVVINRVIGGTGLKRKISTGKMRKKLEFPECK